MVKLFPNEMLKNGRKMTVAGPSAGFLMAALLAGCAPTPGGSDAMETNKTSAVTNQVTDTNVAEVAFEPDVDKSAEHLGRGNALLGQGKYREAVAEFELAAKYNSDDEDAYYNLGLAQARAGDKEAAKQSYRKSLEIFPDYVEAHNNLGNILVAEGNFAEAIEHFQQALKQDEKNASAHNNLGTAYARQKKVANALVHFETAVQLQPDYPDAQFNLGNAYLILQRFDDAIATFTRLLEFHPEFARARTQLDKARAMKGAGQNAANK